MINKTEEEITCDWQISSKKPLVSICCATYNHENYISEAIDGFLMQETDFPFEIIIRDDASTDATANIIKRYQVRYPNIIKPIYEKVNCFKKGIRPLPILISQAQGKYISICEGDDYWTDPKKLQIQKEFMDSNADYVICYTDCTPFDEDGTIEKDFHGARRDLSSGDLQKATPIFTLTSFFRNILPLELPKEFCLIKYGDLSFWSQLGEFGKGKYLPQIKPSMYRVHTEGLHSMLSKEKQTNMELQTYFSLYAYHFNRGNRSIALHFATNIIIILGRKYPNALVISFFSKILKKIKKYLLLKWAS